MFCSPGVYFKYLSNKKIHVFWILSSGDDDSIFSYSFLSLDLKVTYKYMYLWPERALCDQTE